MSHQILALFPLLLLSFAMLVLCVFIFTRYFLNFPMLCLKLLLEIPELFINPIKFLTKIVHILSLQHLLTWLLTKVEEFCFNEVKPIIYGEAFIILLCTSFLFIFYPSAIILEGVALITVFFGLFAYKFLIIKYQIKPAVKRAKLFERAALNAYKRGFIQMTFSQFEKALAIYNQPAIANNFRFDIDRAKLFEQIGIVLYNKRRSKQASRYFSQAFDIYQEPHDFENAKLMKVHIRALKTGANILLEMGRRKDAWKRYKLIYELTGVSAIPENAFNQSFGIRT